MIVGTVRDMLHRQRHPDPRKSREGLGRAFLRRVASLVAVQIPMELLKVATECFGILPAHGRTPKLVIGG